MCPNCRAFISAGDRVCPYCQTDLAPQRYVRRAPADAFGGLIPHARFTTTVIMLINFGLYVATALYSMRASAGGFMELDGRTLLEFGAKFGPAVVAGQWWRLITAGFLHGGLLHIAMNMWVLFDLGAQVEELLGTSRYLAVYLIANVTAFIASLYLLPALSIGASGAIFGLIGGLIGMGLRDRTSRGSAIRRFYMRWAIYGLALSVIPGTDWAAHVGGLTGGFVVGFIAGTPGYSVVVERAWQIIAGIMTGITALAFYDMISNLMIAAR